MILTDDSTPRISNPVPTESATIPGMSQMQSMIDSGECWRGGEGHPLPSRVWLKSYDRNSGAVYVLRGESAVSDALEQLFEGVNHDIEPAAFCK